MSQDASERNLADDGSLMSQFSLSRQLHSLEVADGNDVEKSYKFFLARSPEAGVLTSSHLQGISKSQLISLFLTSSEFLDDFIRPLRHAKQPSLRYLEALDPEVAEWAASLLSADSARLHLVEAESIWQALDYFLIEGDIGRLIQDNKELIGYIASVNTLKISEYDLRRPELVVLGMKAFPKAFNWQAFSQRQGLGIKSRWKALNYLIKQISHMRELPPLFDLERSNFLSSLAAAAAGKNDTLSIMLLQTVSESRPLTNAELIALGRAFHRQNLPSSALIYYKEASVRSYITVDVACDMLRAALQVGQIDFALSVARISKARGEGSVEWRRCVEGVIESWFQDKINLAYALYGVGKRIEADELMESSVELMSDLIQEFTSFSPKLPHDKKGRVVILADVSIPQCKQYRVDVKSKLLSQIGRSAEIFTLADIEAATSALIGAEALIIYRLPAWPGVVKLILGARSMGTPIFYEIDDLIFESSEYPDTFESYGGQIDRGTYESLQLGVPLFLCALRLCDYGIASTEPLGREIVKFVKQHRCWIVPNVIDPRMSERARAVRFRETKKIVIFYGTGTRAHNSDFNELVAPALLVTLARFPDVHLVISGYISISHEFDKFSDRIVLVDFVSPVESYWDLLRDSHINIAVLKPSLMADCKSEIKWLEAAALGIPSIVSPTEPYISQLRHGKDVLFASSPNEWSEAFASLIVDTDLRLEMGRKAKAKVQDRFVQYVAAKQLGAALDQVQHARLPAARRRIRLLICNVFFPPNTLGGATRVVRNNIDDFLSLHLDGEFELAIFTTDVGVEPEGHIRVDNYKGLAVFRVSVPHEVNMDWRPKNSVIGSVFSRVVELWGPDLVHFHCIQRLSGSIVDVCRRTMTPYVITAHDAWWISDYQFLVDEGGLPVDVAADQTRYSLPTGITRSQSSDRAIYLRALLAGAQAVLGVSNSFSSIYRSAGVRNVLSVPNGLADMPRCPRTNRKDGRVRLAHVGNVTPHKGFPLILKALSSGRFSNLVLTAVDHAMPPGSRQTQIWGSTEVILIGPISQESMPEFYAEHDVLLAPSIWPESFGLVTREALAAGMWVIASDRGAIADDIVDGVNGFIVPVDDHLVLLNVLLQIDRDALRFIESPPQEKLRSSVDQAMELSSIYRKIVSGIPLFS